MGFTPQVLAQIPSEEVLARFQMKCALFIAAHYGNVDLARSLMKQRGRCRFGPKLAETTLKSERMLFYQSYLSQIVVFFFNKHIIAVYGDFTCFLY
jgi:hypothetical protein